MLTGQNKFNPDISQQIAERARVRSVMQNMDWSTVPSISCFNCKGDTFDMKYKLKTISALQVGSNMDQIVPVPVFICIHCGAEILIGQSLMTTKPQSDKDSTNPTGPNPTINSSHKSE